MSQELAQDEGEADAEDYEIDSLERGTHQRLGNGDDEDDDFDGEGGRMKASGVGNVREENVVFQMGEDSDDEDDEGGKGGKSWRGAGRYNDDVEIDEEAEGGGRGKVGKRLSGESERSGDGGDERERLRGSN